MVSSVPSRWSPPKVRGLPSRAGDNSSAERSSETNDLPANMTLGQSTECQTWYFESGNMLR